MKIRLAAKVEYETRQRPVADETLGGTPMAKRTGLQIEPPPSPSAPATHPPTKPKHVTIQRGFPYKRISLSTKLIPPYFCLIFYTPAFDLIAMKAPNKHKQRNSALIIKSKPEHVSTPMRDSLLRLPVNKLSRIRPISSTILIAYFPHCI